MAEKRMFAQSVIDSDLFLEMPMSSQLLYFHLSMRAENKGLINNCKSIMKILGCSQEDLDILIEKEYLKNTFNGTYEIVHWYENNGVGETAKKRNSYKYRLWRKSVINRDRVCVICKSKNKLNAHHIKEFSKFPLLRFEVDNGITLCEPCHKKVHKGEVKLWQM